ncbi:MAG: metal-dependent hydrolase [Nanoarchaeota archaeon]
MLRKTHLVIGLVAGLYFLPHVNNKFIFLPIVLIASLFPDIDSGITSLGQKGIFRFLQMMTKHRGIMHTYTICVILSLGLGLIFPPAALPFFLGYSFHLFADSFTPQGIRPFWPLKAVSSGLVTTGSRFESIIFIVFSIIAVILFIALFI